MQEANEAANAAQPQSATHARSWTMSPLTSIIEPPSSIHLRRLLSLRGLAGVHSQTTCISDIPFCFGRNG